MSADMQPGHGGNAGLCFDEPGYATWVAWGIERLGKLANERGVEK